MSRGELRFSDQQQRAISRRGHTVVRAGAGSGKTRVIVEWYCRAFLDYFPDARIDEVVAVTFTEKAAAELKTRISQRLQDLAAQCDDLSRKERIEELRALLPLAPIGTIHSLCARILRDFWREAGIEPTFIIIDELRKEQLIGEAIEKACTAWQEGSDVEQARLAALLGLFASRTSLNETLRRMLQDVAKFAPVVQRYLNTPMEKLVEELPKSGDETFAKLAAIVTTLQNVAALFKEVYRQYQQLCSGRDNRMGRDYLDFAELELRTHHLLASDAAVRQALRQTLRAVIVDEYQDTSEIQWAILQKLTGLDDDQCVGGGPLLYVVGDPLQSIYSWRQAKPQIFQATAQRLRERTGSGDACEVGLTINYRTRESVLDVINTLCYRIFDEAQPSPGGNEVAPPTLARCGTGVNFYVPLQPSASSSIGRVLWVTPPLCESTSSGKAGQKGKKSRSVSLEGGESGGSVSGDEDNFAEARRIVSVLHAFISAGEASSADGNANGIPKPYSWRDVAILCRKRRYFAPFEVVLTSEGIPYRTISSMGFYDQLEIVDLITALRAIDEPEDDFALLGFLRGGLVRCSDSLLFKVSRLRRPTLREKCFLALSGEASPAFQLAPHEAEHLDFALKVLQRAQNRVGLVTVDRLVEDLLEQTGAWGIYALGKRREQAWANVQKFLAILRSFKTASVAEVLEYLESEESEGRTEGEAPVVEASDEGVKLMTIHAAKGLEFPIVVLASLDNQKRDARVTPPLTDGAQWFVCEKSVHRIDAKEVFPLYDKLETLEKIRQVDEEKRVLYVALTRAKDYLILSTTKSKGELKSGGALKVADFYNSLCGVLAATWDEYQAPTVRSFEELESHINDAGGAPCLKVELEAPTPKNREELPETSGKTFEETLAEKRERVAAYLATLGHSPAASEGPTYDFPTLAPSPLAGDRHLAIGVTEFLYFLVCPKMYFQYYIVETTRGNDSEESPQEIAPDEETMVANFAMSTRDRQGAPLNLLTASERGSFIHAAIAEIFGARRWDFNEWTAIVRNLMTAQMPHLAGETGEGLVQEIVGHLRAAWSDGKFAPLVKARWARFEQSWVMKVDDELHLSGTIDCEFENEAGEIEIADFKTGTEEHEDDFLTGIYENQIKIYLLMTAKRYPTQEKFCGTLIHTAPGKRVHSIEMRREELHAFQEMLRERGHQLRDFLKRYAWGNLVRNPKLEALLDEECRRRKIACPVHGKAEH